jgi:hypothetical protein
MTRLPALLLALVLLPVAACGGRDSAGPAAELPDALAARSDVPYVRGRVVERMTEDSALGLRVRVQDAPGSTARVTHAVVAVRGARLLWRDGSEASLADLHVGGEVIVWQSGPETRSDPPQVTADAILLDR